MQLKGIIHSSKSQWTSPLHIVPVNGGLVMFITQSMLPRNPIHPCQPRESGIHGDGTQHFPGAGEGKINSCVSGTLNGILNFPHRFLTEISKVLLLHMTFLVSKHKSKKQCIAFTSEASRAFLRSNHIWPEAPLQLVIDASSDAISTVLRHVAGDTTQLVSFLTMKLSPHSISFQHIWSGSVSQIQSPSSFQTWRRWPTANHFYRP